MSAYGIISAFGLVVLLASVQCSKIHKRMAGDERVNIFRTNRDKMPEYAVAPERNKRSDRILGMQFTYSGMNIDTYLHPSDGQLIGANTPVWLAFTKPDGTVEYKKMREGIVGRAVSRFFVTPTDFYTVAENQAINETLAFDGIVGGRHYRSLSKRSQKEARPRRNSEASDAGRPMFDNHYRVITKSTTVTEQENIRQLERQIRKVSRPGNRTDAYRIKGSNPKIVYPSVLVQTDFKRSTTRPYELHYYEEIIYQLAFWNAVDLRFRHVNYPKIRIRITGIIIGLDHYATPYLGSHMVDPNEVWHETRMYWYKMSQRKDFPVNAYDIAVTMTDTDTFYSPRGWLAAKKSANLRAVACDRLSGNKYPSVAIVRDKGGFDGILKATHALGRFLGLDDDKKSGDECDSSNGFIMQSQKTIGPKNLEWSPCSLRRLSYLLRTSYMNCFDEPAEFYRPGYPVIRVLPGDVSGSHKQCQARGYNWACKPSLDMCTQMKCYRTHWEAFKHGWWCENTGPAAEGTLCASGHKCVDGLCQCMTEDCLYIK